MHHLALLIRVADPSDSLAVARLQVRSWQAGYRGLLPDDYLNRLSPEERARHYTFGSLDPRAPITIVASEAGLIHGFATLAPARDPDLTGHGELCALYVDPDWWDRGVGAALAAAARRRLVALGFETASAWVLAGNLRAERFYRKDGWQPDGSQRTESVWGVTVREVRFCRHLDSV